MSTYTLFHVASSSSSVHEELLLSLLLHWLCRLACKTNFLWAHISRARAKDLACLRSASSKSGNRRRFLKRIRHVFLLTQVASVQASFFWRFQRHGPTGPSSRAFVPKSPKIHVAMQMERSQAPLHKWLLIFLACHWKHGSKFSATSQPRFRGRQTICSGDFEVLDMQHLAATGDWRLVAPDLNVRSSWIVHLDHNACIGRKEFDGVGNAWIDTLNLVSKCTKIYKYAIVKAPCFLGSLSEGPAQTGSHLKYQFFVLCTAEGSDDATRQVCLLRS